jgi:rubrerythrin
MKLTFEVSKGRDTVPPSQATLWQCEVCDTFISIHSAECVTEPLCPICGDVRVQFCGELQDLFGPQFDA